VNENPKVWVEPFRGTVNVMFSDAMIASTKEAVLLREEGQDPTIFIPLRDIYFEFLSESATVRETSSNGRARYWNVQAVGEAADDVMWAYDQPAPGLNAIRQHAAFDPSKVTIEAVPQEDIVHEPHAP